VSDLSVCLSVGLSVGNDRKFWKNGWFDRDAVDSWSGGLKKKDVLDLV